MAAMKTEVVGEKPHAVCIPYPAQGHLNPMLKLAKLLHHRGFYITFVNSEFNLKRLLRSRGPNALDGVPGFRFESIPDGLPPVDVDATQDIPALCESIHKTCSIPFQELLGKLNGSSSVNVPPVTCIVSDTAMHFTLKASEELGIPNVFFWTASACGFMAYAQFRPLIDRGLVQIEDLSSLTDGYLETIVDWVPGMKNMRLRDFPSFIRSRYPGDDFMVDFNIEVVETASRASGLILNTFDALEQDVLHPLLSMFPQICTTGPLSLLVNHIADDNSIGSNLWREELECLQWLDFQQPSSVVYLNFGSITVMTPEQLVEFAWGLANSGQPFVWIIRPDLVVGDSAILPLEFVTETKQRGLMVSWCPQEKVLNHPSVGGFLTHCGWNSTIESICAGIPMACWPFFAEQQTNCRYCKEWGIGMEIDSNVERGEVEKVVREMMEGEKGKNMKKAALEWRTKAEEATAPCGSSYLNLNKLVDILLAKP